MYELIVRRFLGCCSKNACGLETTVEIDMVGEVFSAKGALEPLSPQPRPLASPALTRLLLAPSRRPRYP